MHSDSVGFRLARLVQGPCPLLFHPTAALSGEGASTFFFQLQVPPHTARAGRVTVVETRLCRRCRHRFPKAIHPASVAAATAASSVEGERRGSGRWMIRPACRAGGGGQGTGGESRIGRRSGTTGRRGGGWGRGRGPRGRKRVGAGAGPTLAGLSSVVVGGRGCLLSQR